MKKKIAVIFGSMSSEHEISCMSAYNVIKNIDTEQYDVDTIGIDKKGNWFLYLGSAENIGDNSWTKDVKNKNKILNVMEKIKDYDVVFPVLHGKYGEDGSIQGIFEFSDVKYVGCKILGSAIAINKILSKDLVQQLGIKVVDYIALTKNTINNMQEKDFKELSKNIKERLGYPVIIKPNKEGSSYGIVKVNKEEELKEAITFSLKFDKEVLIERYIEDRIEIECAVLEDKMKGKIFASIPGQIVSANELYDYEAKYKSDKSYVKIPALIDDDKVKKIQEYSKKIFEKLKLSSLARIDFFIQNNNIYFNEANTLPGFTNISMYPMMIEKSGINYKELISILINNEIS